MADDEKLRADARENRDRILDVAREAFAADPSASLNSIAKAAGVGAGTLYRHFPSREALVLGVYRKEIDAQVALAPLLLTEHPPLQAFRMWCDRLAEFGRMKHGVADLLHAVISEQDFQETYWPMVKAVRQLMDACEDSGDIRPGADAEDFLALLGFLWQIPPTPEGEVRVKRLLALVFRGLGVEDPPVQEAFSS
jgi:AcrR family transcriptional regulator